MTTQYLRNYFEPAKTQLAFFVNGDHATTEIKQSRLHLVIESAVLAERSRKCREAYAAELALLEDQLQTLTRNVSSRTGFTTGQLVLVLGAVELLEKHLLPLDILALISPEKAHATPSERRRAAPKQAAAPASAAHAFGDWVPWD